MYTVYYDESTAPAKGLETAPSWTRVGCLAHPCKASSIHIMDKGIVFFPILFPLYLSITRRFGLMLGDLKFRNSPSKDTGHTQLQ